jgi:hypothetical protein
LDIKAETCPLNTSERDRLREANDKLAGHRRTEESKWAQRAKVKHVQEGGNNTKYFHLIANGKHRRKKIFQLEQEEGTIVGDENLKVYITEYYKKLFGAPVHNNFSLREDVIADIPKISNIENTILTADFTKEEMTHKYRGCIIVLSINKSVEPNEEQKVLTSGFDQSFTINTSKRVFRGIW